MPGIFPFLNKLKRIRKCVIVKQVSLYYMELEIEKEIYIYSSQSGFRINWFNDMHIQANERF